MLRKKLNVQCLMWESTLKVRIVEIQELEDTADLSPSVMKPAYGPKRTFNQFLYQAVAVFNGLHTISKGAHNLYETFKEVNSTEIIQCTGLPVKNYEYNYLRLNLPADWQDLSKLLGVIDSALHELTYNAPENNCSIDLYYCDHSLDYTKRLTVIEHAFLAEHKKAQTPLSRHIATWLVGQYESSPIDLAAFAASAQVLKELLKTPNQSLTHAIRTTTHPNRKLNEDITTLLLSSEDNILRKLLEPGHSHSNATNSLIGSLRLTLKENTREIGKTGNDNWLEKVSKYRQKIWHYRISTLYSRKAAGNGFFRADYTEIELLQQADMDINDQGLMVLKITNTKAYQSHYRNLKNGVEDKKLELELRRACQYLDLQFLPDQNFHENPVFTRDSTFILMNWRMHISSNYCKRLILAANNVMRLFARGDKDTAKHQINHLRKLPIDIQAQIAAPLYSVHPRDLREVSAYERTPRI